MDRRLPLEGEPLSSQPRAGRRAQPGGRPAGRRPRPARRAPGPRPLDARRGPAEPKPEPAEPDPRPRPRAVGGRRPRSRAATREPLAGRGRHPRGGRGAPRPARQRAGLRAPAGHAARGGPPGLAAARATADDHDALVSERDAAIAARDEARANANLDHDAVIEERDQAVSERAAALYARDEALDERAAANFERKNAIAERDAAFAERDRAIEAHRAAVRDLEALEQRTAGAEQARLEAIASAPPAGAVQGHPRRGPRHASAPGDRLGPARRRVDRPHRVGDRRLQGPARPRLERGRAATSR